MRITNVQISHLQTIESSKTKNKNGLFSLLPRGGFATHAHSKTTLAQFRKLG
jgi:hypothetical protein